MKVLFVLSTVALLAACNNNDKRHVTMELPDRAIRDSVRNPLTVQPESQSIPKDMQVVKDSVIKPKPGAVQKDSATTGNPVNQR